jgi:hypothetical protein
LWRRSSRALRHACCCLEGAGQLLCPYIRLSGAAAPTCPVLLPLPPPAPAPAPAPASASLAQQLPLAHPKAQSSKITALGLCLRPLSSRLLGQWRTRAAARSGGGGASGAALRLCQAMVPLVWQSASCHLCLWCHSSGSLLLSLWCHSPGMPPLPMPLSVPILVHMKLICSSSLC